MAIFAISPCKAFAQVSINLAKALPSLELIQSENHETAKASLLSKLSMLDTYLTKSEFISGSTPLYADFIVFGTLKWLIETSQTFQVSHFSEHVEKWFLKINQMYCGEK
jgi:glutathione S-transferase